MINPLIRGAVDLYPKRAIISHMATQLLFCIATGRFNGTVSERSAIFFAVRFQETLRLASKIDDPPIRNSIPPHLYSVLACTDPELLYHSQLPLIAHTAFLVDDDPPTVAEGGSHIEEGIRLQSYERLVTHEQKIGYDLHLFPPSVLARINFPSL